VGRVGSCPPNCDIEWASNVFCPPNSLSNSLPPCFDRVKLAIQIKQLKDFLAASGNSEEGSMAVAEISYLLGSKDRVTQILFSEVLRLSSLCLCQPCFLRTSVLNSSASEDLAAEYDGTEETHAPGTYGNKHRHFAESRQKQTDERLYLSHTAAPIRLWVFLVFII